MHWSPHEYTSTFCIAFMYGEKRVVRYVTRY